MTVTGPAITLQVKDHDMAWNPAGASALLRAWDHISLLPAHLRGESHSQMEGFQAEDRHNPLPHIGPYTTVLN